jgi:peptide/nickel transport system permease protein
MNIPPYHARVDDRAGAGGSDAVALTRPAGFARRFARHRGALWGAAMLFVIVLAALAAPFIWASPWDMVADPLLKPFEQAAHPLGTDMLGRDLLAGLVWSARVSLAIGLLASGASLLLGVTVGAIAGWRGGWVDSAVMGFAECFQIAPPFALAVVIAALLGASLWSTVVAITVASWPIIARLVRSEFLSLREREFVQAAVVIGQTPASIVWREILPNALSPIIATASLLVAAAILTESALSFLGLGSGTAMSWGFMIGAARTMIREAWWMSVWPGIAIVVTVLCVNLVSEGLRDALSVRSGRVENAGRAGERA